ncbi:hypothetical protein TPELBph1_CDS0056 [Terrisporobacter phage TPELB_ph1]
MVGSIPTSLHLNIDLKYKPLSKGCTNVHPFLF